MTQDQRNRAGEARNGDVRERPIHLTTPEVRAILAGRKTQIRRPVKCSAEHREGERWTSYISNTEPKWQDAWCLGWPDPDGDTWTARGREGRLGPFKSPFGSAGDRLWVREAFRLRADQDGKPPSQDWWKDGAWYEADPGGHAPTGCAGGPGKLRPAIHMPRWASRLTLAVKSVCIERLHDITEGGAKAEGVEPIGLGEPYQWIDGTHRTAFNLAWGNAYGFGAERGGYGWDLNPWVWVATFEVVP